MPYISKKFKGRKVKIKTVSFPKGYRLDAIDKRKSGLTVFYSKKNEKKKSHSFWKKRRKR